MTVNTIDSIHALLEVIASLRQSCPGKTLFFRGQKKRYSEVNPSIGREGYLGYEDILFKEYVLRNPDEFTGEKTTFEKLVKMQHYRLPTRLLDVSTNPLVALFFAVEESEHHDSEDGDFVVFAVPDEKIKYFDSDTVSAVANIARRPIDKLNVSDVHRRDSENDADWIKRFNETPAIQYLLHEIKEEKPYFKNLIKKEHLESIWCVRPLLKNRRIIKQDGAFLLFGISGDKGKLADYDDFLPQRFAVRSKEDLRRDLELLGISKDKLYPELDTTAEYLKKKYAQVRDGID